ncbi:FecR family protein [Sphingobacterium tabacisoli]|uniref:FecR family protein n=1 Tax=Sphingobacterium tabacisoli TaxID=2044855 RepID=A0ABW5L663_9SPHI|nr:FecR family protein [Sphingobacterium tabacisoli]
MIKEDIKVILDKIGTTELTVEEQAMVDLWLFQLHQRDDSMLSEEAIKSASSQIWTRLDIPDTSPVSKKPFRLWHRWAMVAAIFIAVVASSVFILYRQGASTALADIDQVSPGKDGATLTLADGRVIVINDLTVGDIAEQSGVLITKGVDGQLVYELSGVGGVEDQENTLSTSNGETYQVRLPDGSKVWLNAGSSLTYSPQLVHAGRRRVKLAGEAYFEVAKDKSKPFIVQTRTQEVEVLGTSFNVNAYLDEPVASTTLIEGSIKIKTEKSERFVKPGEQAVNNGKDIQIVRTDVENCIDWKEGDFYLNHVDFKVAMRKIARWYDMEVVYDGSIPDGMESGGWIARDKPLSQVLKSIESSGMVKFKIVGRTIHVVR